MVTPEMFDMERAVQKACNELSVKNGGREYIYLTGIEKRDIRRDVMLVVHTIMPFVIDQIDAVNPKPANKILLTYSEMGELLSLSLEDFQIVAMGKDENGLTLELFHPTSS